MVFDDFLADREANAAARIFTAGMQAFEDDKDRLRVLGSNADSVVGNREHPFPGLFFAGDLNDGRLFAAKLYCIGDQVLQHL